MLLIVLLRIVVSGKEFHLATDGFAFIRSQPDAYVIGGWGKRKKRQRLYSQNRTIPPKRSVAFCGVSHVKCQNILKGKAVPTRALDIWVPDAPTCRPFVSICRMEHRRFIPGLPDDLQSQRNTIPIKTARDTYGGKTIIVGKDGILR